MLRARRRRARHAAKHPRSISRRSSYRLGNAKETTAGKDFFIIVNRLLTIANAIHRLIQEPYLATGTEPQSGQTRAANSISGIAITSP